MLLEINKGSINVTCKKKHPDIRSYSSYDSVTINHAVN